MLANNTPSSQGLALGSTSLYAAARSRPMKLVDGKAKPCHDEGVSVDGEKALPQLHRLPVRRMLVRLDPCRLLRREQIGAGDLLRLHQMLERRQDVVIVGRAVIRITGCLRALDG